MKLLYIGDVMGPTGIAVLENVLPELRREQAVDVVIAQGENITDGKGLSITDYQRLRQLGVDGFSGGNHTIVLPETTTLLNDPNVPVTGPANMLDCPGPGFKYLATPKGKVLMISLLGKIVGRDADKPTDNPLLKIDEILASQQSVPRVATIVNFHGDYSSEKVVFGHYLDGRVSAVVGDHWHIPTADAMLLPAGTAYQTDVGMCGALDSSLGVRYDSIVARWRDNRQSRNILEHEGRMQCNALVVDIDETTGLATAAQSIRRVFNLT